MKINYTVHPSPYGACLLAAREGQVCYLAFLQSEDAESLLKKAWPNAELTQKTTLNRLIEQIFSSNEVPSLHMEGTPFQQKVWEALQKIPAGKTRTYSEIAQQVGSPRAVRAVGTACGRNKIAYLIPCHRVLAAKGKLGGFRWGLDRKIALLKAEGLQTL